MPRLGSVPKYRCDSKGRAFVQHRGIPNKTHRLFLGRFGTPESRQRYQNFLSRLNAANGGALSLGASNGTVVNAIEMYLDWAERNYTRETGVGSEFDCMLYALRPLDELFGATPIDQLGPRALVLVRSHLAAAGRTRTGINRTIGRIKRFIRWCCENELAPPGLYHNLLCVRGLYPGQENVREAEKKSPASVDWVKSLLPFVSPPVAAMMRVQYLCGMRPGETCIMRECDIKRDGETWFYYPQRHKTAWRNYSLVKAIPKAAQPVVADYLDNDPTGYLFRPQQPKKDNPRRRPGPRYTTASYRGALDHGFAKAQKNGVVIPRFTPNQLRRAILTDVSRMIGQQSAQRWAGHADLATTNVYVSLHEAELADIASKLNDAWQTPPL